MRPNHRAKRAKYGQPRRTPPGTPPGTLAIDPQAMPSRISGFTFTPDQVSEHADLALPDVARLIIEGRPVWINIDGLGDADTLREMGKLFHLHPLALEDVVNLHQRPKFEDYDKHHFVVLRMPLAGLADQEFQSEQVSLCFGSDFVVTFQEVPGDVFEPVRRRLRSEASQIRKRDPDYLAYALIDAAIDAFFPVLERFGEQVEALENDVIGRPTASHIGEIHRLKHELLTLRRSVWPMRDMIAAMLRDDSALIAESTRVYLRDCHDHTTQLIDMIETYREIASGLVEIHLSSLANRTNEVMQVLTLIATIFIPLTFVVGVYGMNFNTEISLWNMPELNLRYGYPVVMVFMLAIAVALVILFRRKGWIGRR